MDKRFRIAVGGIEHESCSFTTVGTGLEEFISEARFFDEKALLERSGEANTIVDGFLKEVRRQGAEVVPLVWFDAPSGGQASRETYQTVKEMLLEPLRRVVPVDGVLLSIHGAFSAEGVDDADGDVLQAVREIVGPDCPVMAVHDLHSNLTETMFRSTTAMIVEDTYPHVDMAERAIEAADMLLRTLRGEIRPTQAWRSLPLFWGPTRMITGTEPMVSVIKQVHTLEQQPGVLTASLSTGYQWADVPCAGASVVVITDGDPEGAQAHADRLARWIWDHRELWRQPVITPEEALAKGDEAGRYPVVIADQADNSGGGAPGDSTEILRLFLNRRLRDSLVLYMVDPETAREAKQAGVGATVNLRVGGKSHPLVGPPVEMTAKVLAVTDGRFVFDGPMWAGLDGYVGDSALLEQDGVYVVVITFPNQPVDTAFCRTLGIDCTKFRYISVKSTGHFRSGFGPIAGSIFNVDAVGLLSHDTTKLPFRRLGRKVFPNDLDTEF